MFDAQFNSKLLTILICNFPYFTSIIYLKNDKNANSKGDYIFTILFTSRKKWHMSISIAFFRVINFIHNLFINLLSHKPDVVSS